MLRVVPNVLIFFEIGLRYLHAFSLLNSFIVGLGKRGLFPRGVSSINYGVFRFPFSVIGIGISVIRTPVFYLRTRFAGRSFLTIPLRLAYSNRRRRLSPTSASFVNGIGRAIKTGRASSFYFPHILRTRPAGRFFLTIPLRPAYSSRRRGFPLLSAGFGNGIGRAVLYGGGASSLPIPHIVHNHTIIPVCDR